MRRNLGLLDGIPLGLEEGIRTGFPRSCSPMDLRDKWLNARECGGLFLTGGSDVVHLLKVEPVFRAGGKIFADAQGGGGGDALAALDDGSDAAVGQVGVFGEAVLGDAQIVERFLEGFPRMRIVKQWSGFHVSGNPRYGRSRGLAAPIEK